MTDTPWGKISRHLSPTVRRWADGHEKLLSNLFSLLFIHIAVAGVGFITRVKIANVLGKIAFGDLAFGIAVGAYGLMFVQYGLDKSLVRELVHFPKRFGELLKASLILRAVLFLFFLLSLAIAAAILLQHPGYSWGMVPVILATAILAFQLQGVYDAWKEMRRHAIYFMIQRCTYFALVWCVILLPFLSLSLGLVGAFMIVAAVSGLFLQYRWALPRINFAPLDGLRSSTRFIMRSNFWIWLAVLSGLSIDYFSQIILKLYGGSSELGGYSAAWLIVHLAMLFLNQIGRIGAEAMARYTRPDKGISERLRFLTKYTVLMTVMGFLIGLPCLLFPGHILRVFKPEYADAATTLRLFGIYPILYGPYLALLQYVISSRMQRTYFTLITIVGILSIGLSLWLIPQMQGMGAAISVIASLATALALFAAAVGLDLKSRIESSKGGS